MKVVRVSGDYTVEITGMEELAAKMQTAIKVYPDISYKVIDKARRKLRKDLVDNTGAAGVGVITGNLTKGYTTKQDGGTGLDVEGQLIAETRKNPHFHLIEHGHRIVPHGYSKKPGNKVKRERSKRYHVGSAHKAESGYHMKDKTLAEFAPVYPKYAMEALDKILKESGL